MISVRIVETGQQKASEMSDGLFPVFAEKVLGKTIGYRDVMRSGNGALLPINNTYFSISHAAHHWCVCSAKTAIGIDIEESREIPKNIQRKILASNEGPWQGDILRTWVIKEAYSKMLGLGLKLRFDQISVAEICQKNHVIDLSTDDYILYIVTTNADGVTLI